MILFLYLLKSKSLCITLYEFTEFYYYLYLVKIEPKTNFVIRKFQINCKTNNHILLKIINNSVLQYKTISN